MTDSRPQPLWEHARVHADTARTNIRSLVVPAALIRLIETGRWKHPGGPALARVVPWFEDQLDFLPDADYMERQSRAVDRLADDDESARLFHLARRRADPVALPWLDVDHAILIAISHNAGDDTALALDYRTGLAEPRVVASDIWTVPNQYHWRVITPTFAAFAAALGLDDPARERE